MNKVQQYFQSAAKTLQSLEPLSDTVAVVANALKEVFKSGGRLYTCGNGGSTCDAVHFVEELVARFKRTRPGFPAHHLCDAATLTCWSNDFEFESVFERQVHTFVSSKDALVVFSTSGNSPNILRALEAAKQKGALTIGLLGKGGGKAKELCNYPLVVASDETSHIQEAHISIVHILCELIET